MVVESEKKMYTPSLSFNSSTSSIVNRARVYAGIINENNVRRYRKINYRYKQEKDVTVDKVQGDLPSRGRMVNRAASIRSGRKRELIELKFHPLLDNRLATRAHACAHARARAREIPDPTIAAEVKWQLRVSNDFGGVRR